MVTEMPVISPGEPPTSCAGCGGHIADRYYLQAVDRQWHGSCLTCHSCKAQLDNELTCFYKDGHIYCKEDYYRLFPVKRCSRCQLGIYASELVMRARDLVFHLHCFTCTWCNAPLAQGDTFGLRDDLVYCRPHYETLARDAAAYFSPPPGGEHRHPLEEGTHCLSSSAAPYHHQSSSPLQSTTTAGRKGRPRKKRNGEIAGADALGRHGSGLSIDPSCNIHLSHLDGPHPASQSSPPLTSGQRTKRMRTSFKHHQLRTMKSYFAINQNPDAKDLKQLAQKTGLSKRVLQVWFQNARAKWRRNNMKQQDSMSGIITSDQPSTPQLHQSGGHLGPGMCSPGSSYSENSPVHSCGGPPSDGSLSTQVPGGPMDFDSSNPMTPLVNHYGLNPIHNGEQDMRITSFHELF